MVSRRDASLPPFGRRAEDIRPIRRSELAIQRGIDILVSLIALVLVAPLFVLLALVVKMTSDGPVFFRQDRARKDSVHFRIVKFRTMRTGTDVDLRESIEQRTRFAANSFKLDKDDPRITPIGKYLRRTSLDELPQLLNVLRGDMSLVGIRPLVPEEYEARSQIDRELYGRVRPGITGLWQISGRSSVLDNQRIVLDRAYSAQWDVGNNLSILIRTPGALLRDRDGAF